MKAPVLWFALALSTGSILPAAEVQPGASLEEVYATLGTPTGQLHRGGRHVLYYERGEIELQNGTLTRVALRSPEEHAIRVAREEQLRGEREARRALGLAEGTALRDRKLADASFQAAPVAYQVAFWEDFARRYPEVSCSEPLTIARLRLNEQIQDKLKWDKKENRLAEIEERYAAADRSPVYYPVRTYYTHSYRRHHGDSAGLGPITYTFFDTPLPPYTTPSGNPAGNPASSEPDDQNWPRWEQGDHPGRQHGRSFAAGSHGFRERM